MNVHMRNFVQGSDEAKHQFITFLKTRVNEIQGNITSKLHNANKSIKKITVPRHLSKTMKWLSC